MNARESAAHGFVEGECERVSKCVARGEEKSSKLSMFYIDTSYKSITPETAFFP